MTTAAADKLSFTPPFSVVDYIGKYGKAIPIAGDDKRIEYGGVVEAYWHRVFGSKPPMFLVDFRVLGKKIERHWWFREYRDMAEGFLLDYWDKPLDMSEFKLIGDRLHHEGRPLTVSMHGPKNAVPYILAIGIKKLKLFTIDDPFVSDKDRDLYLKHYHRVYGFPAVHVK